MPAEIVEEDTEYNFLSVHLNSVRYTLVGLVTAMAVIVVAYCCLKYLFKCCTCQLCGSFFRYICGCCCQTRCVNEGDGDGFDMGLDGTIDIDDGGYATVREAASPAASTGTINSPIVSHQKPPKFHGPPKKAHKGIVTASAPHAFQGQNRQVIVTRGSNRSGSRRTVAYGDGSLVSTLTFPKRGRGTRMVTHVPGGLGSKRRSCLSLDLPSQSVSFVNSSRRRQVYDFGPFESYENQDPVPSNDMAISSDEERSYKNYRNPGPSRAESLLEIEKSLKSAQIGEK